MSLAARVLRVVIPTTTIAALLYYFGYIYAQSFYLEFRLDETGFGLTTSEYLTRSANVILGGVLLVAVTLAVAVGVHVAVVWVIGRAGPNRSRVGLSVAAACLVVGVILMIAVSQPGRAGFSPSGARAAWLLGALLTVYGGYLGWRVARRTVTGRRGLRTLSAGESGVAGAALLIACFSLAAYGAFQLARTYAVERGREVALWVEQNCDIYSQVRVYSTVNLHLDHPGVTETVVSGDAGDFRYRYEGLRQFDLDDTRYLMWPAARSPRDGVFALPNDERIRVEPADAGLNQECPDAT